MLLTFWSITLKLNNMSENSNDNGKIYCGSGTEKFDGNLVEVSVCLSRIPQEHRWEQKNQKTGLMEWWTKLKVQKKRDGADEYGKTHYLEVDTWKPEPKTEAPKDDLGF